MVKKGIWYYAKSQPTHPHREANYTLVIEKAEWFKEKPNLEEWSFDDPDIVEVLTIEVFYRIKD